MATVKQNTVMPSKAEALSPDGLQLMKFVAAGTRPVFETILEGPIGGDDTCLNLGSSDVACIAASDGRTHLHICATFGRHDILAKRLPSLREKIDQMDNEGRTALHLACRYGHTKCVDLLIQAGAKMDVADLSGCTAVHLAIKHRRLDIAQALIRKSDSALSKSDGTKITPLQDGKKRTPLHEAVLTGSTELCRLVIQKCKESLNTGDTFGRTPLMLASSAGLTDVVICILEEYTANRYAAYAIPHPASKADSEGATAIHYAVLRNDLPLLKEVVKHSYLWLNKAKKCGSTALHIAASNGYIQALEILLNAGAQVDPVDAEGATPLHRASRLNQSDCVDMLLLKGANVEIRDFCGKAAWHWAADAGNHEVLATLLNNVDQTHIAKLMYDNSLFSPLHYTCINGRLQCTEVLLDWAKAVNQVTLSSLLRAEVSTGSMAVHFAASRPECSTVLASLLHYEKDAVSWIDGVLKTPLHLAAEHDCVESVKLLLHHKADLSATDIEGRTALHLACVRGSIEAASLLISNGSDISQRDWQGKQPMMLAAEGSHDAVVKLLLDKGCNINALDDHGCTALHAACAANSAEVVQLLLDRGCDLTVRNEAGMTALQTSITRRCIKAAVAIVNHDKWEIAMSFRDDKGVTPMTQLIKMLPSVAKIVLDRCYTTQPSDEADLNPQRKYNFKYLIDGDDVPCRESRTASPWPVQAMVSAYELITHPVVQSMVDHRWQKHGRKYMLLRMATFALHFFLLILYSDSLTSINTSSDHDNCSFSNTTNFTIEEQCQTINHRNITVLVSWNSTCIVTQQVFLLLTSTFLLQQDIRSWRKHGCWGFALEFPQDICTLIIIGTTIMFVLPPGYQPPFEWQRHFGWIAILTTAFSFLLLTRWVDHIGVISICISHVILLLIMIFFFFILGFLLIYSMVFLHLLNHKDGFSNFETAVVSAMNMAVGDINFSSVFLDNDHSNKWAAIVVEILFVFTFNIALTSFATAVILRDVEKMLKEALCSTMHYKIAWIQRCKPSINAKNGKEYYIKEKNRKGSRGHTVDITCCKIPEKPANSRT